MLEIKAWLETTGMKVAETCFKTPPELPYIIFIESIDVSGADLKNNLSNRGISIELYSLKIDKVSEALIENLLNEKSINYKRDNMWLPTEKMFETTYDFNITEKI